MARKTPVPTGAAYRKKAGLKPVSCDLTPDEHEIVREAAFLRGGSMAAFARAAVVETARKVVAKKTEK